MSIKRHLPHLLIAATALFVCGPAVAQRAVTFPLSDAFGNLVWDQTDPVCAAGFIDIAAGGTPITFTPSGTEPALDDGGAVITLGAPFELYGRTVTEVVVSSNGYLSAAAALTAEGGGDFSNDCPLPAIAEEQPASGLRIAVLHDDLDGSETAGPGTAGTAHHQSFTTCPRPSGVITDEGCTIIQWTGWHVHGSTATFDLQAVLYHQSFAIAVQYSGGSYTARPTSVDRYGATVGIQDHTASDGLTAVCNLRTLTMAGNAFCFFEPRFPPPTGDLWLELDEKMDHPGPGGQLEYFMRVVNPGPGTAGAATVSMNPAPELTTCSWTCTATPGSSCTAAGSGSPIDDTIDLAPGGAVDYQILCDLDPAISGTSVTSDAAVTAPSGFADPDPTNNTAAATTDIPVPVTLQRFTVE